MGNEQRISSPRPRPPRAVDRAACARRRRASRSPAQGPSRESRENDRPGRSARTVAPGRPASTPAPSSTMRSTTPRRPTRRTERIAFVPGLHTGLRSRRGFWRRHEASRGRTSALAPSSPSTYQRHPGPRRLLPELGGDFAEHGQHGLGAERDNPGPGFELGQEEHLVDQLDGSDRSPRRACSTSTGTSSPGSPASSSSESSRASGVRSSCETAAVKPERNSSYAARSPASER